MTDSDTFDVFSIEQVQRPSQTKMRLFALWIIAPISDRLNFEFCHDILDGPARGPFYRTVLEEPAIPGKPLPATSCGRAADSRADNESSDSVRKRYDDMTTCGVVECNYFISISSPLLSLYLW